MNGHQNEAFSCLIGALNSPRKVNGYGADYANGANAIIEKASKTLIAGCKNTIIPKDVTRIGECAFGNCYDLMSITIPDGVTSIGESAFAGCSGLMTITIPEGVISIDDLAFNGCTGLTGITIPEGVTNIGWRVISGCSDLTSIVVDEGNSVYTSANGANAIIDKASNTLIAGCKSTIIPESVTSIGNCAFYGSSALTSISIPESVTSIEWGAFQECSTLTSITIPKGVTSIGEAAFWGCSGLTEFLSMIGEPFAIDMNCWEGVPTTEISLYVPKGTKSCMRRLRVGMCLRTSQR